MENSEKPLRRSHNKKIAGVCGGIAEKLEVDPVVVRLVFVLMVLFGGGGLLVYLILWFILPEASWDYPSGDKTAETSEQEMAYNDLSGNEKLAVEKNPKSQLYLGFLLIGAGLIFLAAAFIPAIDAYDLWPVVLIAVGVYLLKPSWSKTGK